jgi:hypothetical protein
LRNILFLAICFNLQIYSGNDIVEIK